MQRSQNFTKIGLRHLCFSDKFTLEHSRTATSILPLLKSLISTKSNFSVVLSQTFYTVSLILNPFTLVLQGHGDPCTFQEACFFLVKIIVPSFVNAEILLILFQTYVFFHYSGCGQNFIGKMSVPFEIKLSREITWSWNQKTALS